MVRIEEITVIHAPIERCFDLARSVEVHLAGNVHFGEQAAASGGVTSGLIGLSEQVTWRAKHFGFWDSLTSRVTRMHPPTYFQDPMVEGIFQSMQHDHYFHALRSEQTEMKDVFCFAAPLQVLGLLAEQTVLRRYMRALLRERNAVIKQIAESDAWREYLPECAS